MEIPIIKVENLSHRYTSQWAVRDINLQIDKPGIYGLLGSNGAGKSTTMNIICGAIKQSEGSISIKGVDTIKEPVLAKKYIGYLPQKASLYVDLTVEEYLTYAVRMHLVDSSQEKVLVDEALRKCSITHFRKRLIRNLSGGYQQRVGIAQAIIHNPDIVVLDEPTNGLDPNQILDIRELIRDIARNKVVLLSTHILREIEALCNYIYMIDQGTLVFSGSTEEFDNYIIPTSLVVTFASSPTIEEIITIDGIREVEELGGSNYRIYFDGSPKIAHEIVKVSVERGWRLSDIQLEKSSFDTIFAELSKQKK